MTIGYEYDLSGNRTSAQSTGSESYLKTYAYDKNNRLTDISTQSQTLGNKYEYFYYDYNGNQIEKQTITNDGIGGLTSASELYTYDEHNRVSHFSKSGTEASYTYNADGKRISKTVNQQTTDFIWNGSNMIASGDEKYNYGPDGIESANSQNNMLYIKDIHGNVTDVTDATDDIQSAYAYDSFGNILSQTEEYANPFRYCGEYYDEETDNIYLRNRYYNPDTGRFITEDTHWNVDNMIYGDKQRVKKESVIINRGNESNRIQSFAYNYKTYDINNLSVFEVHGIRLVDNRIHEIDSLANRQFENIGGTLTLSLFPFGMDASNWEIRVEDVKRIPNIDAIMQSTNLYGYCTNNPLSFFDPSGYWKTSDTLNTGAGLAATGTAVSAAFGAELLAAGLAIVSGVLWTAGAIVSGCGG